MEKQLQEVLLKFLTDSIESGKEQIPSIIEQYLAYQYTTNVVFMSTLFTVSVVSFLSAFLIKKCCDDTDSFDGLFAICVVFASISLFLLVFFGPLAISENLGISNNPKGYLLDSVIKSLK